MALLIIKFRDESCDEFSWAVFQDEATGNSVLEWKQNSESGLAGLLSQHRLPVAFVIPQQCVFMTQFELPEKASRQVVSSIEYQIEDQLGEEVERQHFAIGDVTQNPLAIAVVNKSIMQRCQFLQKKFNIDVANILPEIYLCPWAGNAGEVSVIESYDSLVIRYGDFQGLKCRADLLEMMLELIDRDHKIQTVNYITQDTETYEALTVEKYASQNNSATNIFPAFLQSAFIDLRQREFQKSSVWKGIVKVWKWVAVILVILISVTAFNRVMALNNLQTQLADIKLSQYNLIKNHLPPGIGVKENLKKEFIKVLQERQPAQQEIGFLGQLFIFTESVKKYSGVSIIKIGYQKNRLNIDVSSSGLADLEALQKDLESSSLKIELDNLNIKPDIISGRFLLVSE